MGWPSLQVFTAEDAVVYYGSVATDPETVALWWVESSLSSTHLARSGYAGDSHWITGPVSAAHLTPLPKGCGRSVQQVMEQLRNESSQLIHIYKYIYI